MAATADQAQEGSLFAPTVRKTTARVTLLSTYLGSILALVVA